jgi:hypothetical protein
MPKHFSEWATRLFQVVLAVVAIAGLVNAWNAKPNVWLTYQLQAPGALPVRVERCGEDDVREYFYRDGPDGTQFNIDLCFKAVQKNHLKFIPYATDEDGKSWIELRNSPQVGAYTRTVAHAFVFPTADQRAALSVWQQERRRLQMEKLKELAISLIVLSVAGLLAGWIIRRVAAGFVRRVGRHGN